MNESTQFRCPFEVKGEQDGTILDVVLPPDLDARLACIKESIAHFHAHLACPAVRFLLPDSFWQGCEGNKELALRLAPFQAEILACDLESHFGPLLPYLEDSGLPFTDDLLSKVDAADLLIELLMHEGLPVPRNTAMIAAWLEVAFLGFLEQNRPQASFRIGYAQDGCVENPLMTVMLEKVTVMCEYAQGQGNPLINRNLFMVVKTPFYPRDFGRYSPQVVIALNREADIVRVPRQTRRNIRTASNSVLRAYGHSITDLAEDKQPMGLWVPGHS